MKWPWTTAKEAAQMSEENKHEIEEVKDRAKYQEDHPPIYPFKWLLFTV